jgi:hypothetical protein
VCDDHAGVRTELEPELDLELVWRLAHCGDRGEDRPADWRHLTQQLLQRLDWLTSLVTAPAPSKRLPVGELGLDQDRAALLQRHFDQAGHRRDTSSFRLVGWAIPTSRGPAT